MTTTQLDTVKKTDLWQTPPRILDCVNKFYNNNFFDPCPIGPQFDGLELEWCNANIFVNPPFSEVGRWVDKAVKEFKEPYWQTMHYSTAKQIIFICKYGNNANKDAIKIHASAICDIRSPRIAFINPDTGEEQKGSNLDCIIYYLGYDPKGFCEVFSEIGECSIKYSFWNSNSGGVDV